MTTARALLRVRAVRHGLAATAVVLVLCAGVAVTALLSYTSASARIGELSGRAVGQVVRVGQNAVEVNWPLADGTVTTALVDIPGKTPPLGQKTQVAYDPEHPDRVVVPGAALLVQADRALSGLAFTTAVVLLVLAASAWRLVTRARAARAPGRAARVRRIRVQSGLIVRSWLEVDGPRERWIPVYYDPALAAMPSPAPVVLHGDRLVVVDHGDVRLYPSGPATSKHPRGRRGDSPAEPDPEVVRAAAEAGWTRQLRADAVLVIPAPFVGLFWAYLDGSGFSGWLAATLVTAGTGLWLAAWRGADPS
ncbi:hypothetical protein [Umezawaea sp.]|uniref:hypothetical protein n=1 Tax=Umezawaea sp. TaxID=1955258 RepID=UPI002ED1B311